MSFKHHVDDAEDKLSRYRDGVDLQEATRRSLARLFGRLQDGTNSHQDREI
jgi:hypothetical protein